MAATASADQIKKFTLRKGDTIITKDSETADDIAIAAYVPQDLSGVICGYHLSMVRPLEATCGAFVKRLFDSIYVKSCCAVSANGLTRVGLGRYALDNLEMPFPPKAEQKIITAFLDRETAKIDELIAEQQESDRTAQGKAAGGDFPRRHQRPEPRCADEGFWHRMAGRSAGALGCGQVKVFDD